MKIVYDISVLGMCHKFPERRTGIFRVVENITYGLVASQECDLNFCSSSSLYPLETLDGCLDYLASNPQISTIPLPHSKFRRLINSKLCDINIAISETSKLQSLFLKLVRKPLYYTTKILEAYSCLIDPKSLSEAEIFHSCLFGIPEQVKKAKKVKSFLTVYDLIPILYPHFFVLNDDGSHFLSKALESLERDDWVISISHSTKNDLCDYLKIDPSRVFVTHLAADSTLFYKCSDYEKKSLIRKKYNIPDAPYIVSVSTLEPRKNIDHVIRCFAQLIQQENIQDLYLVLVGNKGWKYDNIFDEISNYNFLENRVILTGYVANEDLAALYSGALAFVYPSFYEGFGLPPLEAMQCGVPVITSNTSSLPEVVGDAGIMLAPTDTDGLCHSMLEIYNSSSVRESMSFKSLERAKQFSWEKCIQETINAYKAALNS